MNSAYIAKVIRPFVRDNKLTYDDFDKIFGFLPRKEQYSIADAVQDDLEIELVDELPAEDFPIIKESNEIKMPNKLLIRMIQDGDERARQDLCIKNRGLVEKIAANYKDAAELETLIGKCNALLIKAAEQFDFAQGIDFESHAAQVIKEELSLLEKAPS